MLDGIENDYDYVIIDCPPSLGLLTLNVLAAANSVLIPIQCEYYGLEGISQLLNTVRLVQQNFNPGLAISGVLLTMYDARLNLCRQVAEDAKEYFGAKMFVTPIPRNVRLAEAPSFGKPILLYDVQSVGAKSYLAVAQELMPRIEIRAGRAKCPRRCPRWRHERDQAAWPRARGAAGPDDARAGRGVGRAPRAADGERAAESVSAAYANGRRAARRAGRVDPGVGTAAAGPGAAAGRRVTS